MFSSLKKYVHGFASGTLGDGKDLTPTNILSIDLGNDIKGNGNHIEMSLSLAITSCATLNNIDGFPPYIYVKLDNSIAKDSDFLSSDSTNFLGVLCLDSSHSSEILSKNSQPHIYKLLSSPLQFSISSFSVIYLSFWARECRVNAQIVANKNHLLFDTSKTLNTISSTYQQNFSTWLGVNLNLFNEEDCLSQIQCCYNIEIKKK